MIEIFGNWRKGYAYDIHTVQSIFLGVDDFGHNHFSNQRSEMGELVYQFKYNNNNECLSKIINTLKTIKGIEQFDYIIPVPSSKQRSTQPVDAIASALGQAYNVPVLINFFQKKGSEIKSISDPVDRYNSLINNITIINKIDISNKNILLVDDLYRSGTTLNACCDLLKKQAKVKDVCVLTMTKTKNN